MNLLLFWEVDASQVSGLQQGFAEESLLPLSRGKADSIHRHGETTSSSDAGLWPDVGRDFFIKATPCQAVCLVQCRITALELGDTAPPNAALQEADESQLQAIPCGKRLPSAGVPTVFLPL